MTRIAFLPVAGTTAALLFAAATPAAHAAEAYDNCKGFIDTLPATISTQGTWCLRKDIATSLSAGTALSVATNNVTIDCNHFKLGGLGAGASTLAIGIYAENRLNTTVRNCNVRGFGTGIYLAGTDGGGHLVTGNRLDSNRITGIQVVGTGNTVRGNLVLATGGSPTMPWSQAIWTSGDADVIDNTVDGVVPTDIETGSIGIAVSSSASAVVQDNRVRRVDGGEGLTQGIILYNGTFATVQENHVALTGGTGTSSGIVCQHPSSTSRNRIAGFDTGLLGCEDDGGNIVTP